MSGPERHLWNLAEQMVRMGCEVDVATTYNTQVIHKRRFGVQWEGEHILSSSEIPMPGGKTPLRTFHFPVFNLPTPIGWWAERHLQRRWEWEEMQMEPLVPLQTPFSIQYPLLLTGWHDPETMGSRQYCWSMRRAAVQLPAMQNASLHLQGAAPRQLTIRLMHNGIWQTIFRGKGPFQISARLDDCPHASVVTLETTPTTSSLFDPRTRGFQLTQMSFANQGRIELGAMNADHRTLRAQQREEFLHAYLDRANKRPPSYAKWVDRLRGPHCPGMHHFLKRHVDEYDWVISGTLPYGTLPEAAQLRRQKKFRLAALPLFHVEDGMYYWKHYLEALRTADICLANSMYAHTSFFPLIQANSIFAGAGVDEISFRDPNINGDRFRKQHYLNLNEKIILSVGRKNNVKRYRTLIRAVDNIQDRIPCKLVLIGPDEDGMPISSPNCMYLGPVSQEELLDAYDACNLFALVSESESFGMAFVEAWMREKAVIGSRNCASIAHLIRDEESGLLANDREDLENHLLTLLGNPELSAQYGRAGRQQAMEQHTWPVIARKILDYFEKTMVGE